MRAKIFMITVISLLSFKLYPQCSTAPVGSPADPAIQMKINGDNEFTFASANTITSTEEGVIVWNDTNNKLSVCDGSNWVELGSALPNCANGQILQMGTSSWECGTPSSDINYVFVTAATFDGDLGGLSGADSKCQTEADAAGLDGVYMAWLATGNTTPPMVRHSRFLDEGYYLSDGTTRVANNWADLTNGNIDNAINKDANGNTVNGTVWTKVDTVGDNDGTVNDCGDWTDNSAGEDGYTGSSTATNSNWTETGNDLDCNNSFHLYCFKQ